MRTVRPPDAGRRCHTHGEHASRLYRNPRGHDASQRTFRPLRLDWRLGCPDHPGRRRSGPPPALDGKARPRPCREVKCAGIEFRKVPGCFGRRASLDWGTLSPTAVIDPIVAAGRRTGLRPRTGNIRQSRYEAVRVKGCHGPDGKVGHCMFGMRIEPWPLLARLSDESVQRS